MRRLWWAFVRFSFHLFYNQLAWTYDTVAWLVSLGQWKAWGRTAIPYLRGKRILELAHGPGHLLVAMAERGLYPVGLDLSPTMGRMAGRRLARENLAVPRVRARAQALPFRDACFDSTVATFPSEFILDPATLRETGRVTGATGRLVVVAWASLGTRDPVSRVIMWLFRLTGQREPRPGQAGSVLAQAGFVPRGVWEAVGRSRVMLFVADRR